MKKYNLKPENIYNKKTRLNRILLILATTFLFILDIKAIITYFEPIITFSITLTQTLTFFVLFIGTIILLALLKEYSVKKEKSIKTKNNM